MTTSRSPTSEWDDEDEPWNEDDDEFWEELEGESDLRPRGCGWWEQDMICIVCSHEWTAVYEEDTCTHLECPECSFMNPLYEEEL